MIEWLNANGGAVTAAATVVLVAITGYYAWRTNHLAKVAREQIQLEYTPNPVLATSDGLALVNLGKHAALIVSATSTAQDPEHEMHPLARTGGPLGWARQNVLAPQERASLVPFPDHRPRGASGPQGERPALQEATVEVRFLYGTTSEKEHVHRWYVQAEHGRTFTARRLP